MQIYVHRDNQQLGPFTEAEIKAQLAAGTLTLKDNVWWQGQVSWMPLEQTALAASLAPTPLVTPPTPAAGGIPGYVHSVPAPSGERTSSLAMASLVCGVLSFLCGILAALPAVVLGHMALSEIKKNPAVKGHGMALAGLIIGYLVTVLFVVALIAMMVLMTLGNNVKSTFDQINSQLESAQNSNTDNQSNTNAPPATVNP